MRAQQISHLIGVGATQKVRQHLKKLSLKDRLPLLHDIIPYVKDTPENMKFFREHFSQEIGALIAAQYNYELAEKIYNKAKELK
jgi:hypothetical protein